MNKSKKDEQLKNEINNLREILRTLTFKDPLVAIKYTIILMHLSRKPPKEIRAWLQSLSTTPNNLSKYSLDKYTLDKDCLKRIEKYIEKPAAISHLMDSYKKRGIFAACKIPCFLQAFLEYAYTPWRVYLPYYEWNAELLQNYIALKYNIEKIGTKNLYTAVSPYTHNPNVKEDFKNIIFTTTGKIYLLCLILTRRRTGKNNKNYQLIYHAFDGQTCSKVDKNHTHACNYNEFEYNLPQIVEDIIIKDYKFKNEDLVILLPNKVAKNNMLGDSSSLKRLPTVRYIFIEEINYLKDIDILKNFYNQYRIDTQVIWYYINHQRKYKQPVNPQIINLIFEDTM